MFAFFKRAIVLWFVTVLLGSAPAAPVFPVKYSGNNRYLVDQNETPFPIMGRTAWFITSLSVADYQTFVDDTSARGYSAIEFHVVNHDARGNNPPFNGNGDRPFLNRLNGTTWNGSLTYGNINNEAPDFTTPNEAYWSLVDSLLAYCESKGILVFMFPAYVGYAGGNQGWMQEMVANGATKMQSYGAWIATRYKNQKNLVWMMGGDMGTPPNTFNTAQTSVEGALLTGLKSVSGQQSVLFSAQWDSQSISTDQVNFGTSMTLNGAYSWTGDVNNQGRRAYAHSPVSPAFLLEEPYDEEGPDGNGANGSATQPVRRFQWWGWLSTIGGYISGNGYVWPFPSTWRDHLDTQGTRDMTRLNAFMGSIAWYNWSSGLNGMRTLITAGGSSVSASSYVTAAATPDGTLLVAYVPPAHSGSISVDMGAMSGPTRARWFDPTSAAYTSIGTGLANSGTRSFNPPGNNSAGAPDWVLVLDNTTGNSPAPPTISDIPNQTTTVNTATPAIPFTINDADTPANNLTLSATSSNPALVPTDNIVFGASGANRTVTVTPAAGQTGTATLTVTVSDGTNNASDPFVLTVNAAAPVAAVRVNAGGGTLTDSAGKTWSADTGFNTGNTYSTASAINNTVNDALYQTERWDPSTSPELTYAFNLPNGDYLVNLHFAEIYSGAFSAGRRVFDVLLEGQLRIDNLDIYSRVGANTALIIGLPVTLNDGQLNLQFVHGLDNPKLSAIEVLATSAPPTISDLPNQSTTVNTATPAIPFTINDPDTPVGNLTLSVSSSNPALAPTNSIVFGGSGVNRTVTVTPATGQSGSSTITVTVSDGTNNASDPFVLTVNSVNTPPTLTGMVDQTINEDTSTAALNFTVGDAETSPGSLIVSKGSSNPVLIPTNSIVFGGSGANRTVTVSPATNQSGTATITVGLSDGQYVVSTNWVVTVNAVNDAPTLTGIPNQTISVNGTTGPLSITIGDADTTVGSLTVSLDSSNPSLVPLDNIVLGGSEANRTVTVSPAAGQSGTATITVSASDGEVTVSTSFVLTVTPPNTPPTLTGMVEQTINEDTSTAALNFTVGDAETSPGSLTMSKGSFNPVLIPTNNIVFGGSGANRTVTVTPAANQNGSSTITVSVSDGQYVVSTNWVVTVSAVNDPPTISNIPDQTISVNGTTGPLNFTIGDVDTAVGSLTVSPDSSNLSLVPLSNIVLGGSGANRTVTVTPAAGQSGTATITVSVSDGEFTVSTNFVLTVSSLFTGTRAFTNTTAITIPSLGAATPYPSTINVSGMGGTISNVTVTLYGITHARMRDIDILLVGPGGQKMIVISDVGPNSTVNNITLTLSDLATTSLGTGTMASGTYKPTNLTTGDTFVSPAPAGPYGTTLSVFNGQSANGAWTLYVVDDSSNSSGSFAGGWSLTVTTTGPQRPSISAIPNQSVTVNTATAAIPFTINDADTPANSLTLSANSSNLTLVPANSIVFGGSGSNRTVTLSPAANQTGVATITVIVSDGALSASNSFVLTVSTQVTGTLSFTNTAAITIPDKGAATPYPSVINVAGLGGTISNVTLTLRNLSHTWGNDIDVLLVGPGGQAMRLMENAGTGSTANNANLTFSNSAAAVLPQTGALASGTYKPTAYSPATTYPSPAPAGPYGTNFTVFNGTGANGAWSLYVFDDGAGDLGSFATGWSLTISTASAAARSSIPAVAPPQITSVTLDGQGGIRLNVRGQVGLSYALEASSDLINWTKVDVQDNTTGSIEFVDQPATNAVRFYRTVSLPK